MTASQIVADKFPDFLMGKIRHSYNLIHAGRTTEVPAIFNNQFSLHGICPDRQEFHISEYVAFHILMSLYFVQIGNIITARTCRNMIFDIEIPENVPVNEEIIDRVDLEIEECVYKLLGGIVKNKKAKADLIALLVN